MKNILLLCSNEWIKNSRLKFFYLGPILSFLTAFLWLKGLEKFSVESSSISILLYISTGLQAAFTTIIPLFTLIFSSMIISNETSKGTIKLFFYTPVSRLEIFISKYAFSIFYMFLIIICNLFGLIIFGIFKFGLKTETPDQTIITSGSFIANLIITYMITSLPLLSLLSFGFLISAVSKSLAASLGSAVGIILGLEPLRYLIRIGSWDPNNVLFMNYLDKPSSILIDYVSGLPVNWWNHEIITGCLIIQPITIIIFAASALIIFLKKDMKTL